MYQVNVDVTDFEPYVYEGETTVGEVHWITRGLSGIWRVSPDQVPGEVSYDSETPETVHVLEGVLKFKVEGNAPVVLRPGDIISFPEGLKCTWEILEAPFREFFIFA